MKILLATDGSPCSTAAVEEVAALPWPADSEVRVISIVGFYTVAAPTGWLVPESYYENLMENQQEQARKALKEARALLQAGNADRPSPLQISTEIISGDPQEAIVARADEWGADLIVVGSHGWRGFKRWWLGSVSQAVLSQANVTVHIVRATSPEVMRQEGE